MWPTKPQIVPNWSFRENLWQPLTWSRALVDICARSECYVGASGLDSQSTQNDALQTSDVQEGSLNKVMQI